MQPDRVVNLLRSLEHSGRFAACGCHPTPPRLEIDGLGVLPLPVIPLLLEPLRALGAPAPYGRGPDTLVDPDVRRCHQIEAGRVRWANQFDEALEDIVDEAAEALGVQGQVHAHLYKVLVYGPGDFFVPHRDTEKEDGMFATLVVALPGAFEGGELLIEHDGATETIDSATGSSSGVRWAAFYADCQHAVRPLLSGIRVALIFNLVRRGAPTRPARPAQVQDALVAELRAWNDGDPVKFVYVLEHRYSAAEFGWERLKGPDQARAAALRQAGLAAGVQVQLAQLSIDVEWSAEELQYRSWRWRRHSDDPDDLELYDLIEDRRSLQGFVDAHGRRCATSEVPLVDGEVWPEGAIDDEQPDDTSYHEATGNEGATLTRMYRRSVVVLWPEGAEDAILAQGGLAPVLRELAGTQEPERLRRLALHLHTGLGDAYGDEIGAWIELLLRHDLVDEARAAAEQVRALDDGIKPALLQLVERLSEDQALAFVTVALPRVRGWAQRDLSPALVHAAALGTAAPARWRAALDQLTALVAPNLQERVLAQLVELAWALDHAQLQAALLALLEHEKDFDTAVDACLQLDLEARCPAPWREHVLRGLRARTRTPPTPPADLARAPVSTCACSHCRKLSAFLGDPSAEAWTYGARKDLRSHLRGQVRAGQLDVDTRELRQGSPHKIVFIKNQRRYEAAHKRHEEHTDALAALTWSDEE